MKVIGTAEATAVIADYFDLICDTDYAFDESEILRRMNANAIDAEPVKCAENVGTDYDDVDQFVCSGCGIELQDWRRVERDDYDGEETYHEYRLRYCPNCGARIKR